jgi:hypothetical protein
MEAGATVAGRLAVAGAARAEIEAALHRAADQALVVVCSR